MELVAAPLHDLAHIGDAPCADSTPSQRQKTIAEESVAKPEVPDMSFEAPMSLAEVVDAITDIAEHHAERRHELFPKILKYARVAAPASDNAVACRGCAGEGRCSGFRVARSLQQRVPCVGR